jgi:hypothetical protein
MIFIHLLAIKIGQLHITTVKLVKQLQPLKIVFLKDKENAGQGILITNSLKTNVG